MGGLLGLPMGTDCRCGALRVRPLAFHRDDVRHVMKSQVGGLTLCFVCATLHVKRGRCPCVKKLYVVEAPAHAGVSFFSL